ncbi:MAG TPA: hypothetical protein VFT98_05900 [Myxococcota bacterium]|nr:hypothetical protein [Myxococcota bacterium]
MVETLVVVALGLLVAWVIAARWRKNRAARSPAAGVHEVPDSTAGPQERNAPR